MIPRVLSVRHKMPDYKIELPFMCMMEDTS